MLENAQPLLEFETKQKGIQRRLRLVRFAHQFWLQSEEVEDWLVVIEDVGAKMEDAWRSNASAELRQFLEAALENHCLGRALVWQEEDDEWLLLWKSRNHFWMNPQSGEAVHFESHTDWHKGPLWTQPNEYFRQRFSQEWQNPHCDARRALAFSQATEEECSRWGIAWVKGGWDEIERVVRAAMRIEFDQATTLTQGPSSWRMTLEWRCTSPVSSRLKALFEVVDERNVRSEKLTDKPRSTQQSHFRFSNTKAYSFNNRHNLSITIPTPSMHEKLEARLFLLDWLREHAPQLVCDWA